jgi:hypothetical protein
MHQNRFPDHNLRYIDNIAFAVSAIAVPDYYSVLDNHAAR